MMIRRTFLQLAGASALAAPIILPAITRAADPAVARAAGPAGAFAFSFETLERKTGAIALAEFAGRPTLVVNTASKCGFAPQYAGLEALWRTYGARGLTVVGAPSRDFGAQEYSDEAKIAAFCATTYAVEFPLTELVKVKGPDAHPFYLWARGEAERRDLPTPRWNFHKYLIGPDGALAAAWGTSTVPRDAKIVAAIEALLPAKS
jgi:glutathione peroxidase